MAAAVAWSLSHGERFECRRLLIPGEFLRFVEVLNSTNIQPQAAVQKGVNRQAPSEHAEHEVVESERHADRDVIEHFRFHAIDAHAYQVGEDGLLLEAIYPSTNVLDDTEVRMNDPFRRGDRKGAAVLMVIRRERVDIKVRKGRRAARSGRQSCRAAAVPLYT